MSYKISYKPSTRPLASWIGEIVLGRIDLVQIWGASGTAYLVDTQSREKLTKLINCGLLAKDYVTPPYGTLCVPTATTVTVTTPTVTLLTSYWGWKDTADLPTLVQILAGPGTGQYGSTADVIADFGANLVPKYLWMAEPIAATPKVRYYGSALNTALLSADNAFNLVGIVDGYRIYMSTYPTQQSQTTIEFQTD